MKYRAAFLKKVLVIFNYFRLPEQPESSRISSQAKGVVIFRK